MIAVFGTRRAYEALLDVVTDGRDAFRHISSMDRARGLQPDAVIYVGPRDRSSYLLYLDLKPSLLAWRSQ